MVELVIVLAIASMILTAAATVALPWIAREEMRSAVYQTQNYMQVARIQAVTRNRECRFLIDGGSRQIQIIDLNDPGDDTDDEMLKTIYLSDRVGFLDPGGGSPITLAPVSGTVYQATFASDGSVAEGAGAIVLTAGGRSDRLTLFGAGGVRVDKWNGSAWVSGG
jgi:Tfp pilus assembly protein FimT